jgi:hypothetical protein
MESEFRKLSGIGMEVEYKSVELELELKIQIFSMTRVHHKII